MEVVVTPDNFSNNSFGSYVLKFKDVTDVYRPEELEPSKTTAKSSPLQKVIKDKRKEILKAMTSREKEILDFVMKGFSNKLIGEKLNISPKTVSIHRSNLMKKVSAKNAAELVRIVVNNGINSSVL